MGSAVVTLRRKHTEQVYVFLHIKMDLTYLIPRTLLGVTYPAFASLKAVLSDSPDRCIACLRYWVVLGVFSVVELLLDPLLNPSTTSCSLPTYPMLKCILLAWCMAPVQWNGSDLIFNKILLPIFKKHHVQIEEQAEIVKLNTMQKFELFFKKKYQKTQKKKKKKKKKK